MWNHNLYNTDIGTGRWENIPFPLHNFFYYFNYFTLWVYLVQHQSIVLLHVWSSQDYLQQYTVYGFFAFVKVHIARDRVAVFGISI